MVELNIKRARKKVSKKLLKHGVLKGAGRPGKPGQGRAARRQKKMKKQEAKYQQETLLRVAKENDEECTRLEKMLKATGHELSDDSEDEESGIPLPEEEKELRKKAKLGEKLRQLDFASAEPFRRNFYKLKKSISEEEIKRARQVLGVKLRAPCGPLSVPPPVTSFSDPSLPEYFQKYIDAHPKITKPTAVQTQCIPAVMNGDDVLGIAPTGSGKTLAYLFPAIPHILAQEAPMAGDGPIALVVVPTRELAQQVCDVARSFRKPFSITSNVVFGGEQNFAVQICVRERNSLMRLAGGDIFAQHEGVEDWTYR